MTKKDLLLEIKKIKLQNSEEVFFLLKYFIKTYLRCLNVFNFNNTSREIIILLKDYLKFLNNERYLLNLITYYFKNIKNLSALGEFLTEVKTLNNFNTLSCYTYLEEVNNYCTSFKSNPHKVQIKPLDIKKLLDICITSEDVKDFLLYESTFYEYISKKVISCMDDHFYGVNYKLDSNGLLEDLKIFIPPVVDLQTALVNIHELIHAHDLYELLGQKISSSAIMFENSAKQAETDFKNNYLVKKYRKFFNKKGLEI